jgi:hypothetical protein
MGAEDAWPFALGILRPVQIPADVVTRQAGEEHLLHSVLIAIDATVDHGT